MTAVVTTAAVTAVGGGVWPPVATQHAASVGRLPATPRHSRPVQRRDSITTGEMAVAQRPRPSWLLPAAGGKAGGRAASVVRADPTADHRSQGHGVATRSASEGAGRLERSGDFGRDSATSRGRAAAQLPID